MVRDKAILELIDIFLNVDGFRSKIQANDLLINVAKEFNPLGPLFTGTLYFFMDKDLIIRVLNTV